ncbi:MAG: response regulator [Planctomycetes bacterium]|nr:response regulator [Planctomycetota bacterium]
MSLRDDAILNRRVLVIDDNEAIHADFRKVLTPAPRVSQDLLDAEAALFGEPQATTGPRTEFELTTASQGREGYQMVAEAHAAGRPFAMAFVDMRMPPGWDGLQTIEAIWRDFPDIEMVICTAFSDYSWEETIARLGHTDRLLIVKKPFDHVEILQVACALTHKWNLQQQSRNLLDNLSELVRDRTAELEQARDALLANNEVLRAAKDAADAANRSKTMFLANVSHELRTPMTSIVGYAQELEDRVGDAGGSFDAEAITTIRRNAEHLMGLIHDLLDLTKLDSGKMVVEHAACDPRKLLAEVESLLRQKATGAGLTLRTSCSEAVPAQVRSDRLRLRQILVNLVGNAVKFTERGTVEVVMDHDAIAEQLIIDVRDTGIGMTAEQLTRVFQPFEQADVSTTRRFGGTGLGLAISLQLAQALGGDLVAESELGAGSCFRLTIHAPALRDVTPTCTAAQLTPTPELGARVLLVEDGRDNQRLIQHLLRRVGCSVEIAENGQQCLDRLRAPDTAFDLVLMDMQMPVMDGLTATRTLRRSGYKLPIVALTANALATDELACQEAGCDAFLSKPIDRALMYRVVAEQVERHRATQ